MIKKRTHIIIKRRATPLTDVVTSRIEFLPQWGYAEHVTIECPRPWLVLPQRDVRA
jgi:hypothetical protein